MSENEIKNICAHCGEESTELLWASPSDGDICPECKSNLYKYCEHCDEFVENDDFYGTITYNRDSNYPICNECLNSDFYCCDDCGNMIHNYDIEDGYCQDCWGEHYMHCEYCERTINRDDDYNIVEGDVLCQRCYENHTCYCEHCGESYYAGNFDDHGCNNSRLINEYNFKPKPVFYNHQKDHVEESVFYGIELEVECSNKNDAASSIQRDFIYMKRDGSLNDGFEVVSHPATLKYHIETNHWDEICKNLAKHGAKSHDTSTCGLHVHISRVGFYSDKHIKKFLLFWNYQENIIKALARRDSNNYCRFKNVKSPRRLIPDNSVLRSETRYEQINLENEHTIEVRRFRGTLNVNTLKACIELCDASRTFSDKVSYKILNDEKLAESEFITYVFQNKRKYPNLFEKLKSKMQIKFENQSE